jgi:hypothetical protein
MCEPRRAEFLLNAVSARNPARLAGPTFETRERESKVRIPRSRVGLNNRHCKDLGELDRARILSGSSRLPLAAHQAHQ